MDGLANGLPRLPMRCVRSLLLCEGLTELHMAYEVDADVAEALLRMPLLANLTVQGPMPLPPDFDDVAVSASRRAPMEIIRFGDKLATDWTPLLQLVRISRRIVLFNKWTPRTDAVKLRVSSPDDVARCKRLLAILDFENIDNTVLDDDGVDADALTQRLRRMVISGVGGGELAPKFLAYFVEVDVM